MAKALLSATLGWHAVAHGETFMVTSLADTGTGSLRAAIVLANTTEEADVILFSMGEDESPNFHDGASREIQIRSVLNVTQPLDIRGPGKGLLILDGGGNDDSVVETNESRIFSLSGSSNENPHRLSGLTIRKGVAFLGGANIRVVGSLQIQRCEISGGKAIATNLNANSNTSQNADGGGLFHSGGELRIESCDVFNNTTLGNFSQGGGIYSENGTATIIASRIFDNTTNGFVSEGGGIGLRSTTVMRDCEVSRNETFSSSSGGGGIYTDTDFAAFNTTVSGNIVGATTGIRGYSVGGAFANVGGDARFVCCTIVDNEAPPGQGQGGGISTLSRGEISFFSTILLGNEAADLERVPGAQTQFRDRGYNLFGIGNGFNLISAQQATSSYGISSRGSGISELDFYGGLTRTHRLFNTDENAEIAAIDAGPTLLELRNETTEVGLFDQRGGNFPRFVGSHADVGAYEFQTFLDTDNDGLPDAVEEVVDGLNPIIPDGELDLDGDGVNNVNEYDILGIAAVSDAQLRAGLALEIRENQEEVSLNFQASVDREYRVWKGTELSTELIASDSRFIRPLIDGSQEIRFPITGSREFFQLEGRIPDELID